MRNQRKRNRNVPKIFAIGDVHLSFGDGVDKPMDIFGNRWEGHALKLADNWKSQITPEDAVILAGDISWALKFAEARADLEWLEELPGKKILVRGNHDLWWTGVKKMNRLFDGMLFLQNNAISIGEVTVCGSRGWICPGTDGFDEQDQKLYKRELLRLEMSLEDALKRGLEPIIGVLHFPPTNDKLQPSGFTRLFEQAGVRTVVYGHLHGEDAYRNGLKGILNGVQYHLVSLDYLDCSPLLIY